MYNIDKYIDLIPELYNARYGVNRKFLEVFGDIFDILWEVANDIVEIKNYDLIGGKTLDLFAENYSISRGALTDSALRALFYARLLNTAQGNTVEKLYQYLRRAFNATSIVIRSLLEPEMVSLLQGYKIPRVLNIDITGLTPSELQLAEQGIRDIKPAGIRVKFNLSTTINPTTDLWGSAVNLAINTQFHENAELLASGHIETLAVKGKSLSHSSALISYNSGISIGFTPIVMSHRCFRVSANEVYILQTAYNTGYTINRQRLMRSTDAGTTWAIIPLPAKTDSQKFELVGVYSGRIIVVLTNLSSQVVNIQTSTTLGVSWVTTGVPGVRFHQTQYATQITTDYDPYFNGSAIIIPMHTSGNFGIMRSVDNGATWSLITAGSYTGSNFQQIAHTGNNWALLCGTSAFYSTNNGATWSAVLLSSLGIGAYVFTSELIGYNNQYILAAEPTVANPCGVFIINTVFSSANPLAHAIQTWPSLISLRINNGKLFAIAEARPSATINTEHGTLLVTNNGTNWLTAIPVTPLLRFAARPEIAVIDTSSGYYVHGNALLVQNKEGHLYYNNSSSMFLGSTPSLIQLSGLTILQLSYTFPNFGLTGRRYTIRECSAYTKTCHVLYGKNGGTSIINDMYDYGYGRMKRYNNRLYVFRRLYVPGVVDSDPNGIPLEIIPEAVCYNDNTWSKLRVFDPTINSEDAYWFIDVLKADGKWIALVRHRMYTNQYIADSIDGINFTRRYALSFTVDSVRGYPVFCYGAIYIPNFDSNYILKLNPSTYMANNIPASRPWSLQVYKSEIYFMQFNKISKLLSSDTIQVILTLTHVSGTPYKVPLALNAQNFFTEITSSMFVSRLGYADKIISLTSSPYPHILLAEDSYSGSAFIIMNNMPNGVLRIGANL